MQLKKPLPISVSELSLVAGTQSSPSLSLCHHDELLLNSHGHHLHITSTITSTSSLPSPLHHLLHHLHLYFHHHHLHLLIIFSSIHHPTITSTITSTSSSASSPSPPASTAHHQSPPPSPPPSSHLLHLHHLHPITSTITPTSFLSTSSIPSPLLHRPSTAWPALPHIVVPLDVDLVEDPFWGLQEVLFHLHGDISGQQAHEQPLLEEKRPCCSPLGYDKDLT